jgi:hypothetical protein
MSLDMTIGARVATQDDEAALEAPSQTIALPRGLIAGAMTFLGLLLSSATGVLLFLR